jgi:hypothetical protein
MELMISEGGSWGAQGNGNRGAALGPRPRGGGIGVSLSRALGGETARQKRKHWDKGRRLRDRRRHLRHRFLARRLAVRLRTPHERRSGRTINSRRSRTQNRVSLLGVGRFRRAPDLHQFGLR